MIYIYIYTIYTDVVSSQLGGLGGLRDCAVILQFHAFDWRPTTKSTKSTKSTKFMSLARFSQIQPGCWDARKALTCVNVQTKGAVETEKTKIENQNKHRKHEFARRLNIQLLSNCPNLSTKEPIRSSKLHKTITSISIINTLIVIDFSFYIRITLITVTSTSLNFHRLISSFSPRCKLGHVLDEGRPKATAAEELGDTRRIGLGFPEIIRKWDLRQKLWWFSSKNGKKRSECKNKHDKSPEKTSCWDKQVENAWLAMVHGCGAALTHCQWPIPWRAWAPPWQGTPSSNLTWKKIKFLKDWKVVGVFAKAGTPSLFIITFQAGHRSPNQDLNTSAMPRCETAVMFRMSCRTCRNSQLNCCWGPNLLLSWGS